MKLFVRTLTGSTLMWCVKKDIKEWISWNHLANSFLEQYDNKLKRKIIELVIEEVMMHNKFGQTKSQSKDKGKVMIKPPKFKLKNDGIPNPLCKDFDLNKHCTFHSGMRGHDTNELHHLKEEKQKLIISGRISQ
ncbi:hypothetical protein HAX54_052504 [Datura stramonium]|uniref:Retrotransposon gag domain-containing protein n=1 Tax=Datura stramonium TaxID=4076 RepID=A0ABS8WQT2_DATST|nr:hypothetical protein [Datura stramonium]